MDPIRARLTPNIAPPTGSDAGAAANNATRKFDVATASKPAANTASNQPVFSDMASQIKQGVNGSLTHDQVRDQLIDHEVTRTFGDSATPEMKNSISQSFKNDPHLSQLFSQLFAKATATGK